MKSELDYSILQKNVNALASCEAEDFFTDISPHLRDHFIIPLLRGKSVSIGDLDFSQFDESDMAIRWLSAWQADLLKHCRYYTLGGPLRPSLFFLKNHRPGDIY